MDARQHLEAVLAANILDDMRNGQPSSHTIEVIHAARNFLSVPEPGVLDPKDFRRLLCQQLKSRADAQHLPAKGAKRTFAYIEGMAGAGIVLDLTYSDHLNPLMSLFMLVCTRGSKEVDDIAEGKSPS